MPCVSTWLFRRKSDCGAPNGSIGTPKDTRISATQSAKVALSSTWRRHLGSTDRETQQRFLADLLLDLVNETGLQVALIGGQAVNYWARPRYTDDFDFTVAPDPERIEQFVDLLVSAGFRVVREQAKGSPSGPDFVRLERDGTADAIDVAVSKTEFQDLVVSRAIRNGREALPIATAEDLLIMKLIANRSKDHEDIFRLLESWPQMDWDYTEHWAAFWHVSDTLAELRERASRPTGLRD